MAAITIDRLTLHLSDITESDGQRLAALIAEGLTVMPISLDGMHHLDMLHVEIPPKADQSLELLSQQIVAAILRQVQCTL